MTSMTLFLPWHRLSKWPKWTVAYAGTAILTVGCFLLLHHAGNQTPYALAAEKVVAEFEAEPVAWGTRRQDIYYRWEYCYITGAVLAGGMPSETPILDAWLPRYLGTLEEPVQEHCDALRRAAGEGGLVDGTELPYRLMRKQWWGSKALYAIGLRFLTVRGYHEFLRVAAYGVFVALGCALALLGWRALVVGGPVLVFGAALSGVEYTTDVGKGTPHVWGVLAPALLAALLRFAGGRAGAPGLFCFFAGMVAAYLWLFEGANFVAAALIGLVAWLHYASLPFKSRAGRAAGCAFAYAAGFLGTMLILVFRPPEGPVWRDVTRYIPRIAAPDERDVHGRDIGTWAEMLPLGAWETHILITSTVVALGVALLVAVWRAWRRDWGAAQEVLWIGGLGVGVLIHFALPNDQAHTAAKLMYLPLALCWSALAAALLRTPRPVAHASAFLALGGALVVGRLAWQHATTTALLDGAAGTDSDERIRLTTGYFNVDLHGNRLIYHRNDCEGVDVRRRIYLAVLPAHKRDLPESSGATPHTQHHFYFISKLLFSFGDRCAAMTELPTYPIKAIHTNRWCCYEGEPGWFALAQLDFDRFRRIHQLASAGRPLASNVFDVHRIDQDLIYIREPCAAEDVRTRFFLHALARHSDERTLWDFQFHEYGARWEGRCVVARPLPDLDVYHIHTGQFATGEGELWRVEFPLVDGSAP